MKVSVLMWDCGFRERFHAVTSYCNQSFSSSEYEVIWVEYYDSIRPELAEMEDRYDNFRTVILNESGEWNYAVCVNEGVRHANSEHLIISDGDVVVDGYFVERDLGFHKNREHLVNYYRRYDELREPEKYCADIDYLENVCKLQNPTNYAGCFSLNKRTYMSVNGYEEHSLFSGPSACAKEAYIRLKNAGKEIRWSSEAKIFHPWHKGTAPKYYLFMSQQEQVIHYRDKEVSIYPDIGFYKDQGSDAPIAAMPKKSKAMILKNAAKKLFSAI